MKCKNCKRSIAENSIFCNWCGAKQVKDKTEISVPKPHRLASGEYTAQIMVNGVRVSVPPQPTEAKYRAATIALKAQMVDMKKPAHMTLGQAIDDYISKNTAVLSASTIRGYKAHRKARFPAYMDKLLDTIDWQTMLNDEAKVKAPKTVHNGWGLVTAALGAIEYRLPPVNLPAVPEYDGPWLDYEQIPKFLDALRGTKCEFQALCALHSLRESEINALQKGSITADGIKIRGAVVMDENNKLVKKDTNKTYKSARTIPIIIPRLLEVLPAGDCWEPTHPNTLASQIKAVCRSANLPVLSCQGLRRSFCSLAYFLDWDEMTTMRIGGWTNTQTIHKHYAKLAQGKKDANIKKMEEYYSKSARSARNSY